MKPGYIYVLSNPAFPTIFKIGVSISPKERVAALSRCTSAPLDFELEYSRHVKDPYWVESNVHKELDRFRTNPRKEFFTCDLEDAIKCVGKWAAK